jgi:predicted NBD/HSP70 family sugar kinase
VEDNGLRYKGVRREDPDRPRPLADAVLRLIWQQRRISRAEIAQQAGLSRSTVSEVVGELLPTGLVAEVGAGPSRGGRRPIILEFRDDAGVILGVEMGAAHVGVALTDLRGRVLSWRSAGHPVRTDPVGTRALVSDLCDQCLAEAAAGRPLVGVGVAVPSPVNPADPSGLSTVVMPEWQGRLGFDEVADRLGVPLMVDNDANLGALAEHWWGAGRDVDDFAYIKLATGIGCGYVIDGDVYRGSTGVAGEIGHLAIAPQGKQCVCGLRGCLVTLVGAAALVARTGELLAEHPDSALAGRRVTMADIEAAALAGDALAQRVATEAAGHLGIALAGLLNLMNPSMVVLGGDLAGLGELLLEPVRETVRRRTLVGSVSAAELRTSELGPRSVAMGAATMVLKEALNDCRLFPAIDDAAGASGGASS